MAFSSFDERKSAWEEPEYLIMEWPLRILSKYAIEDNMTPPMYTVEDESYS